MTAVVDTLEQVLVSGQSLALGVDGTPVISTTSEYPSNTWRTLTSNFAPLGANPSPSQQWPAAAIAYRLYDKWNLAKRVAVDTGAVGATAIAGLSKGSTAYNTNITAVTNAFAICAAQRRPHRVRAVHWFQGEEDQSLNTPYATYRAALAQLQADYDADIKAITGQSAAVQLITYQVNSWHNYPSGHDDPTIGLAQLDEAIANANVHLSTPTYHLEHYTDGVHLVPAGYYHLGELCARAHAAVFGAGWDCLRPISATRVGAVTTVQFNVPVGPLRFDTAIVAAQTNMGFTYTDSSSPPAISSVVLGGDGTSVVVTLASTPTGTGKKIRYGWLNTMKGNLCDSETAVSVYDAVRLSNWCVHFDQAVT